MTDGEIIDRFGSLLIKGHYMEVIRAVREDERARIREWAENRKQEHLALRTARFADEIVIDAIAEEMDRLLDFLKEKE